MSLTDGPSSLKSRQCLVWRTKKPPEYSFRLSPVFTLLNSKWRLKLIYDERHPASYDVFIVPEGELEKFQSFDVTVHFENSKKNSEPLFCRRKKVLFISGRLWRVFKKDLVEEIPDWDKHDDFTVVCSFDTASASSPKQIDRKSVQDVPDTSRNQKNVLDTRRLSEGSVFTDMPSNLESLSEDLAKLLDKNILPDIKLIAGDSIILAHKYILAARSEVFAAMFQHDTAESSSGTISIQDIDPDTLSVFLKYLYSGKIVGDLADDMVSKLYVAGDKYAVSSLMKLCSEFMTKNTNGGNFIRFLILADTHGDREFKNAIVRYIIENDGRLKSEVWLHFAKDNPTLANEVYRKYFDS